jgi:hypothetical protein
MNTAGINPDEQNTEQSHNTTRAEYVLMAMKKHTPNPRKKSTEARQVLVSENENQVVEVKSA